MKLWILGLSALAISTTVHAEPIGRWWSGFGQGTVEYGIKNDSAGSDEFYIACKPSGATINITVSGVDAPKNSHVIVTIGADEYELATDEWGEFRTNSTVADAVFGALWASIRKGSVMRVRLSTGQTTPFTLSGSAKILPKDFCMTEIADD